MLLFTNSMQSNKPSVDVLIGLQWGSEGKGKISAYLAKEYSAIARSGGPQAGHTFYHDKIKYINRSIPCGVFTDCSLYIAPSGIINIDVLNDEIERYKLTPDRLMIDNNAMVLTRKHIEAEQKSSLRKRLGYTCEGVGAAQADKIWRKGILFREYVSGSNLEKYCEDTVQAIHNHIVHGDKILIEGTQGFGLSINHGAYPYVTSRDITVSALLNEIGVSPKEYHKTIGVFRTYPIRVGGNSGPTKSSELSWNIISQRSLSSKPIYEYTTVTGRLRRIFEQDYEMLERAVMVNKPDELALMFIDYLDSKDFGKNVFEELSNKSKEYILALEERLKLPVTLIWTGPEENHMIDRRLNIL